MVGTPNCPLFHSLASLYIVLFTFCDNCVILEPYTFILWATFTLASYSLVDLTLMHSYIVAIKLLQKKMCM